jgi:hypothetical protein
MRKFFCSHTVPAGSLTYEKVCQVADAAQHEEGVRGYRSFANLSEGKVWCVLEANDRKAVVAWFEKMGLPYDSISPLELEGDRGTIEDLRREPAMVGA